MSRIRRHVLTAVVSLLAVVAAAFAVSVTSATQSAWTDRVYTQATVSAGTWNTVTANTCTAVNQGGNAVKCTVTGIRYEGWGNPGDQTRNYYIDFNAPAAKTITFSVDLSSATGTGGTTWSWTNAGVSTAAQFTGTGGWTCGQLPVVTGKANDWLTTTVYFPVYENKTGKTVMCS